MRYDYCSRTDTGLVRINNEDAVAVDPMAGIVVLADGMGGYSAGEVASGIAIDVMGSQLHEQLSRAVPAAHQLPQVLQHCTDLANQAILQTARAHPDYRGMGTTLVVGLLRGHRLVVGHIGDSRCYCWRQGQLSQLTCDHSLLQEQINAGLMTTHQAQTSVYRNLVTRALGVEDAVQLEVKEWPVQAGDEYLFCSDGLTEMVDHPGLSRIMATPARLALKAELLIQAANDAGGRDNISVILVQALPRQGVINRISRLLRR
jgi:PPM family protein phosphatase